MALGSRAMEVLQGGLSASLLLIFAIVVVFAVGILVLSWPVPPLKAVRTD